jgi:hypothetical protein
MVVIPIRVCGDAWSNIAEVQTILNQTPKSTHIHLDFYAEGVSVQAIGLTKILDDYCTFTGRSADTIKIINNPNVVEATNYENVTGTRNHCLNMVKDYWQSAPVPDPESKLFAYFMGRSTIARSYILYDLYHNFADQFVFSRMNNLAPEPWIVAPHGINLETVEEWMSTTEFEKFLTWFKLCPVKSIDGHSVRDHYDPKQNIHQDLLQHYYQFQIELVAETYTIGETFFPTEKTFRPIMAARPILMYGPRHFLRRLQELGFETWSSCWDESYDQLEGPDRWQAIKKLLPTIKLSDVACAIAYRNRQHLKRLVYDHTNI